MINVIIALLSVLLPFVHLKVSRHHPITRSRVIHLLLIYALVFDVGAVGIRLFCYPDQF